MPHDKEHVLADVHQGTAEHVQLAIDAAATAWADWSRWPWEERASVLLRAAELLAGPWRDTLNAATMLGQSKTAHQAEIDAACESIDFLRFNVEFMTRIYAEQPISSPGLWNRMEYRPLEGFVFAVSPFNFTAIAANLTSSPALMGNAIVWKPAAHRDALRVLPDAALPGGRAAGRRDQPRLRLGPDDRGRRAREPAARRDPLHGLDLGLQRHVADGGLEHGALPQLPAHRRRDRRQGLHRRASVRGRRCARDGDRARLVRVPGAEVLGVVARLRPVEPLAGAPRTAAGAGRHDHDGRRLRLRQLHGRRHRRCARSARRPRRSRRRRRAPQTDIVVGGGYDDSQGLLRRAHGDRDARSRLPDDARGDVRPGGHDVRLRREQVGRDARPRRPDRAVRADRRGLLARTAQPRPTHSRSSATRPATSTSTTSRPAPSSASSRSAAPGLRARTTRRARCGT